MREKQNNWQRIEAIIKWANMSTNYFARHIWHARGENLYQIKRGNNGISLDVADRIVSKFPQVDKLWLLTGEGQMLYQYVRNALGLLATGEDKLSQAQQLLLGTLTIGASDTVTGQFLTPYLDEFHHQHPGIRLKIVSGRSAKVVSMLRSGAVDIAFASSPKDSTLETWPCFTTHSVFVAGFFNDTATTEIYTRQEMAEFPLILLERKASSRVFLEQEFLKAGVTLTPEIELSSRQLLVTLAGIGLGVAGVTLEFVRKDLESGDIRLLKTDFTIPERSVDMCTLKEVPPTAAATAFMEMVRRGM